MVSKSFVEGVAGHSSRLTQTYVHFLQRQLDCVVIILFSDVMCSCNLYRFPLQLKCVPPPGTLEWLCQINDISVQTEIFVGVVIAATQPASKHVINFKNLTNIEVITFIFVTVLIMACHVQYCPLQQEPLLFKRMYRFHSQRLLCK